MRSVGLTFPIGQVHRQIWLCTWKILCILRVRASFIQLQQPMGGIHGVSGRGGPVGPLAPRGGKSGKMEDLQNFSGISLVLCTRSILLSGQSRVFVWMALLRVGLPFRCSWCGELGW